jgi:aromatic-amino-acid transaminase
MHLIPAHQGRPSDDPIFALNKEATQRKARGETIVNATVGALLDDEGNLAVLPTAARVVHEVPALEWASYAPISGTPDFLRAVLDDLLGGEPRLRQCAIATATPGGSGALRLAVNNFLEPGHALLTTSWYWGPYATIAEESERRIETFAMFSSGSGPGDGAAGQGLDVGALDAAVGRQLAAQGRALVFLNDPAHNPTGYSMTDDEWRAVVDRLVARSGEGAVTLLVDCAYFLYGGTRDPRAFLAHLRPLVGKVALLFAWSASKSFTQYGLRVGALVACIGDERERSMVESALSYSCRGTWSNCNRGGLAAVTRMLADPDTARACAAERASLTGTLRTRVQAFNGLAHGRGLRYPRYEGGFFVTLFHDHAAEKAAAMRAQGVYVVPQLPKSGPGALRVALCSVAERDIARLVDALA